MYKKILVPLDGSKFSTRALDAAYEIAERFDSELLLTRVVEPVRPIPATEGTFPTSGYAQTAKVSLEIALAEEKRRVDKIKRYLNNKTKTGRCSALRCDYKVAVGHPGEEILKLAKKEKVDLIILSSHGIGGIKRALLGSVTDVVARKAKQSVMIVHPRTK